MIMKNSSPYSKSAKLVLKITAGILIVLAIIAIATITTVDRSDIGQQDFYKETFEDLSHLNSAPSYGSGWIAGWSKANMTPDQPVDLVGYAPRGAYEFVQDSSFVKAITLSNGKTQIAWLSYELLIVHPELARQVEEGVKKSGLKLDQLIFTATHTHSGMGGYMPGALGEFAFGGFDQTTVDRIVKQSISALTSAFSSQDTARITFRKADAGELVANRFVKDGPIDPFVRQLIFTKNSGDKAMLLTYSAHATCLSSKFMGLSGDYPHYLTKEIEAEGFDLALFAAGTVGSHRPLSPGNTPELVQDYASQLDSVIQLRMTQFGTVRTPALKTAKLELKLREPHLRISDELRIRPWIVNKLLGETNAHFDITRIGNILMIASSGEISGVFYDKWEKHAREKGLNLIISSFNGGYIGYITPDELYDEHYHEVREMNWFGPGNGQYFDDLIMEIINQEGRKVTPKSEP